MSQNPPTPVDPVAEAIDRAEKRVLDHITQHSKGGKDLEPVPLRFVVKDAFDTLRLTLGK